MADSTAPVLVGCSQYVDRRGDVKAALSPQAMMAEVAAGALADSGARAQGGLAGAVDAVAAIRTFADSAPQFAPAFATCDNYPAAVARRIGASPGRLMYPALGGNTPQMLVNQLAEEVRAGRLRFAVIVGAEAMRTQRLAAKAGERLDWGESYAAELETPGDFRVGVSAHELRHGLGEPAHTYPLFETALAHRGGRGIEAHRAGLGELLAPFSRLAAANPFAATQAARSPREIAEPSAENRLIAWPYTKYMNANLAVDQAAAVVLTSEGEADRWGIPRDKRVYLAGASDIDEKWLMRERVDYHSAPALAAGARAALDQAGLRAQDLTAIDLYSCFPSAVALAAAALGIPQDDRRGLTVTGGLPFYGGPGNGYTLHAIAETMKRLRGRPGAAGLVSGTGWYLTKHSFGVYSADPPREPWVRRDPKDDQRSLDAPESPPFTETPAGAGRIEAYTVVFSKGAPQRGILAGRLTETGARFLANTAEDDRAALEALMSQDSVGRPVRVHRQGERNIAVLG